MSMESIAGKKPVSHVGKIYNAAAAEVESKAGAIVQQHLSGLGRMYEAFLAKRIVIC